MGAPCCTPAGATPGGACDDPDLIAGSCNRCGHLGSCHKLTEDDGRPILWYSGSYEYISCTMHAPRPAARTRWRRMTAAIYTALAAAIGAPPECECCRASARRKAAAEAAAAEAETTRNALHQLVGANTTEG